LPKRREGPGIEVEGGRRREKEMEYWSWVWGGWEK